ncbi:MAG: MBL fold metallo-hydrolase [Amaricoccus sp.]|uniref:MBL fold metallo-hydrolase n=1 Tax=Amaricoccus sp. TaxID=1872485 RepID=UPI0033164B58
MFDLGSTLRILRPAPKVIGFYDGRIDGLRAHGPGENWLDDGAFALGVCTYAVVDGGEALVYDTHVSLAHARAIRAELAAEGARVKYVVLSHWHVDHVAGNEVFADGPILANRLTAELLAAHRAELEADDPPIRPLVMPNEIFDDDFTLTIGGTTVEVRRLDIHSIDGTVLLLPEAGLLLAGDTLEDPVTYVAEPARLAEHLRDLDRLETWDFARVLPNHGAEEVIAAGGYDRRLVAATRRYVERLLDAERAVGPLSDFIAEDLASGAVRYFAPYEAVHRRNLADVRGEALVPRE